MWRIFILILTFDCAITAHSKECFKYFGCNDCKHCDCGERNFTKSTRQASSRLINAKPFQETETNKPYPWVAYVQNTRAYQVLYSPRLQTHERTHCGGVIISKRSIVTAGHCLCTNKNDEIFNKDLNHRLIVTCPKKDEPPDKDLNSNYNNRLAVAVGTTKRTPIVPEYNANIKAFLYKYEESDIQRYQYSFSINGDVGIIVIRNGLDAVSENEHRHGPICLPVKSFKGSIAVKTVGWGKLFDANGKNDIHTTTRTSCQTNEGRVHTDIFTIPPYDQRLEFLDCALHNTPPNYFCNSWLLDKDIMTLASTIDLPGVTDIRTPADAPLLFKVGRLRNIQEQLECEKNMKNAKIAYGKEGFDKTVDRIVVKDPQGTNVKRICYNLPKVAKYGVCMTKDAEPQHWGFCSRSCAGHENIMDWKIYEEATFILHEVFADSKELHNRKSPTFIVEIIVLLFVI